MVDEDLIKPVSNSNDPYGELRRRNVSRSGPSMRTAHSIEKVASSMFVLGGDSHNERRKSDAFAAPRPSDLPSLSREVTIGRNSQFLNMTASDREKLGGIEYRALKLLLKIVIGTCHPSLPHTKSSLSSLLSYPPLHLITSQVKTNGSLTG